MPSVKYSIDASAAEAGARRFSSAIDRVVADARRAAAAIGQVDQAIQAMSRGAGGAAPMVVRITQANERVRQSSTQTAAAVNGLTMSMRNMSSAAALSFGPLSGLGSRFTAVGSLATRNSLALGGVIAAATGLATALVASVKAAADFEAGMLRVAKVTDASNTELKTMSADVFRLSSTLGIPATELAKIEQGAAQLGIRGSQNLAAFAEQVGMLTRTSDLGAEQATQSLTRLLNLTGESASNIAGMAAALTELGNKSAASESQILSMTLELGRGTAAFDISSQQLLSLGGALAEVGEKSERSATAVSQVLIAITDAASGGDKLDDFARILGVTTERFQELAQKDIGGVFQRILGVLAAQGPQAVATLRELELGSARNTKVLLSLAEVLDRYQRNLGLVAEQYKNPLAAIQEFQRMNDSASFQLEKFGVQLTNVSALFGSMFLPAISGSLETLNAFLLLMQGIEPPADQAGTTIRLLADAVSFLGSVTGAATAGWATFAANLALPPGVGLAITGLQTLYGLMNQPAPAELFPNVKENVAAVASSVSTLNGVMAQSSVSTFAAAFPPLASSIDGVADATTKTTAAYDKNAGAIGKALAEMDREIAVKKALATQGEAAADAQKVINKLIEDGVKVSDADRAAILARAQAGVEFEGQSKANASAMKAEAKSAKDVAKEYEDLGESLEDVLRDLERDLRLQGLDEGQRAVVELTDKFEDLRIASVRGGADEAAARAKVNEELAKAIPLVQQRIANDEVAYRQKVLADLTQEVELRRIENEEGRAAAETQRILNEARAQGIPITDAFVAGVKDSTAALEEFESQSTVVADAFERFIAGIAAGTQELSLDGISDAFRAAFAASVKEKLKFDEIFEGNMLDLGSSVVGILGGSFKNVFSLASSLFGGGGGGGFVGPLLESGATGTTGLGLLGGGGGGALGLLANLALNSGGFFANSNPGASLGLSGLSLVNSGLSLATGSGIIGTLFGASASSATLGSLLGTTGSQGGILGSLLGTSLGAIGAAGGGLIGGIGGAYSAFQLGQGGQSGGQIAASLASVVAGGAAVYASLTALVAASTAALNVIPVIGTVIYGIIVALAAIAGSVIDMTPTAGTLRRRVGESVLDQTPTFEGLQDTYGDLTRKKNNLGANPDLLDQREKLGEDALRDLAGFSTIFSQAVFGDDENGGFVATMAIQWTNILTDFFSRMEGESEAVSLAIRQNLLSAFKDLGVDNAAEAFEILNDAAERLIFPPQDFAFLEEAVNPAMMLGATMRGVGAIFESELPAGVHIAALALESMENTGVKAFDNLDTEGRETLLNLADDAELFDEVVAKLFKDGFKIDVEEFKARLQAITESATFVGEHIAEIFQFKDVGVGIQAVMASLKTDVLKVFQETSMKQLFDTTNIAGVFEPVYAALDRIDEFDLTTAVGSKGFIDLLLPALAQGEANLKDYIPILKVMAEQWEEIQKLVEEATKPDIWEEAATAAEAAFQNVSTVLNDSITAGLAVLDAGGTWDNAVTAFNNVFGAGIQKTFKDAIFAAVVDQAFLQPLIATYQPAFAYVWSAGMIHGFSDPKVKEAMGLLLADLQSDAEKLGLLVFEARVESDGITSDIERAFNDAADITVDWASDFRSTISNGLDAAFDVLRGGGTRDQALAAWSDAIGDGTEAGVTDGIVRALINAAIIEPFIKQWAPIIQYYTSVGLLIDPNDPVALRNYREAGQKLFGPDSDFQQGLNNIPNVAIDWYWNYVGDPADAPPGGPVGKDKPVEQVPGFAHGGSLMAGSAVVGERGMELVTALPGGGFSVDPLRPETAMALLGGGAAGLAAGGSVRPPSSGGGGGGTGDQVGDPRRRTWRPGMPGFYGGAYVGPDDARNPANNDGSGAGGDGDSAAESATVAALAAAFDAAMEKGKDFVTEFSRALGESVNERLTDAIITGFGKQRDIAKESAAIDGLIGKAEGLAAQGKLDADTAAGIAAEIAGHTAVITERAKQMEPILAQFRVAEQIAASLEGIDFAGALSGLASLDLSDAASLQEWTDGLKQSTDEAVLEGITNALLTTGPLADTIRTFTEGMNEQMTESLADGKLSEAEAEALGEGAAAGAAKIQEQMLALSPVFQALGIDIGTGASTAIQQAGELVGGALRTAFNDPTKLNFDTFEKSLRQSVYGTIVDGLVNAFIDAAVIQGALAPMLAVITDEFGNLGKAIAAGSVEGIAAASAAILTQVALITDVIDNPAFKAGIQTLLDLGRDIASGLGLSLNDTTATINTATDGFNAAADAAANACTGECNLKEETVGLGSTTLDAYGRQGYAEDIVYRPTHYDSPGAPRGPNGYDPFDTLNGGGRYGDTDWSKSQEWRRERSRARRRSRADDWYYDDDAPWPEYADGGIAMRPTFGIFGEKPPGEALIPLDRLDDFTSSGGDGEGLDELIEEVRELRRENRKLRESIESRPILVQAKVGEATAIDLLWKLKQTARESGTEL